MCISALVPDMCDSVFTCTGELLGGCSEEQFVSHVTGPGAAGYARLLVAALHPV